MSKTAHIEADTVAEMPHWQREQNAVQVKASSRVELLGETRPQQLVYAFENVSYSSRQQKNSKTIHILKNVCGKFKSGNLSAILGPSGAGKTSMLNVLSGFKAKGVCGNFLINGKSRILPEFRMMSSYIPQDFAMLDLLTVHETLKVSCDLKLSSLTKQEDKAKIIEHIIEILNMRKCQHTLVKNISGGERKRLSIAIELVTNPPLMFFDEPTSGLDSVSSLQLINYLRRLARDGRIIVCVVHQPSSRLMKLFDDILVMSRGEILYSGAQKQMLSHFAKAGFECPNYYNPADFVLDVASENLNENILALIETNKNMHNSRSLRNSKEIISHDNESDKMLHACSIELETTSLPIEQHKNGYGLHYDIISEVRPKTQVALWRQFQVLLCRSTRYMCRNLMSVQLRLVMHVVVAVLLGIVFWNMGNDAAKTLTNTSCLFFVVLFLFFGNSMPSILLCPQDTAVFLREYRNGWYSLPAYYTAKIVADLPLQIACPTFMISIVYYMTGQPDDILRLGMCWLITLMTGFIGHFMGLIFGSTFDLQMAVFLVPGISVPFLIFSGFFIRIGELASFLKPICDISFFRYTMEGLIQAIYGFDRPDIPCSASFCYYKSPEKLLKDFNMHGDLYGRDIFALSIWIIVLVILFFLSLLLRLRKVQ